MGVSFRYSNTPKAKYIPDACFESSTNQKGRWTFHDKKLNFSRRFIGRHRPDEPALFCVCRQCPFSSVLVQSAESIFCRSCNGVLLTTEGGQIPCQPTTHQAVPVLRMGHLKRAQPVLRWKSCRYQIRSHSYISIRKVDIGP